jgi:CO/xanthine dehydrogenase Mo-binding subunit
MSAPAAIANAVSDALGIDNVEVPLTAPRVWELLEQM